MASIPIRIADTLKSFGVQSVFGEAREIEGTTVVPVAVIGYGFGGGGDEENGAGGGGGYVWPIGAYVGDTLGVRFQANPVALLAVGIPFVWATGKALSRIIRALKK